MRYIVTYQLNVPFAAPDPVAPLVLDVREAVVVATSKKLALEKYRKVLSDGTVLLPLKVRLA